MNKTVAFIFSLMLMIGACRDGNPTDGRNPPCPPIFIVPHPSYTDPIWHPSGKFIGFNHTPLDSISYPFGEQCQGQLHFNYDSSGFWLIDSDGTNVRRIFQSTFQNPAWSPDGQWLAFVLQIGSEAHIFKMRFTGEGFDTTTLQKLTNGSRNFFPAWSPDGQWIAYNVSICTAVPCGIWLMPSAGMNFRPIAEYGNYPSWHPFRSQIIYVTRTVLVSGEAVGDSLWVFNIQTDTKRFVINLTGTQHDNRSPKYSPDGKKITFWTQPDGGQGNLWLMDTLGGNLRRVTTEGVDATFGLPFSWSPDGKTITYTSYRADDWSYANGVLWVLDVETGEKRQLTMNVPAN